MPGVTRAKLNNRSGQVPLSRRSYCQPKMPSKPSVAKESVQPVILEKVRYLLSVMQLQYLIQLDAPTINNISRYDRISNASARDPENIAVKRTTLLMLLQTLPPPQKRALELNHGMAPDYPGYKMNYAEAGKAMGVSRQWVHQFIKAALENLKRKISNSHKLAPYRKWLIDQDALALMLGALSPTEQILFEITFKSWVGKREAARLLSKPQGEIIKLRNELKRELDELYAIVQDAGLRNIKTPERLRELYEQRKSAQKAKQNAPKKQIERSLPVEEKQKLLAQGYKRLANPGRDFGKNPIKISELASVMGYCKPTVFKWIMNSPEIVAPNMVLLLNRSFSRGSRQRKLALEHRRRRVRWAFEFAKANGLKYSSLDEFCESRLGFSCKFANTIKKWMFTDPGLIKVFEEYQDVISTKPDRSSASAWAPLPLIQNADQPHLPSDAGAFAHMRSAG